MELATFLALLATAIAFWYGNFRRVKFLKENPDREDLVNKLVSALVALIFLSAVICFFLID